MNGLMRGVILAIPPGRSGLGLAADDAIMLDPNLRHHQAVLESTGRRVFVTDVGLPDTVRVNNSRLSGRYELREADVLKIGSVSMQFRGMPTAVRSHPGGHTDDGGQAPIGDVHGPVQTGQGTQYNADRDQYVAGGNLIHDESVRVSGDYDPSDELFQGKGVGRVLMALGFLIALAGFSMWVYVIFSGASSGSAFNDPFARKLLPGVSMAVAGFAAFLGGGVLAGIGGGLSRAARKRDEQDRYRQQRRYRT